jgi:hypothetical protein
LSTIRSLLDDVEAAFRNGTSERRATALRRITDLFLEGADTFGEEHIALFDDVLCELVDKIERVAIAALSENIAQAADPPLRYAADRLEADDLRAVGPAIS